MPPHLELTMTVLAGFAGGLVGTLWGGFVTGPVLQSSPRLRPPNWQPETAARLLAGAVLYGVCGAAAGFVFWLGWGLAALPMLPWPGLGLLYGGLLWLAAAVPPLSVFALRLRQPAGLFGLIALETLVASVAIGVLCAYAWQRVA
jgi:hypothetical protein